MMYILLVCMLVNSGDFFLSLNRSFLPVSTIIITVVNALDLVGVFFFIAVFIML